MMRKRRNETMVFPATTQASKDTPDKKKERKKERKKEGKKEMFPATTQASKDTPDKSERGAPSYDSSVQGHTKQEKERDDEVPSYDSNVQGHTRQEKEGERKRERERGARSYETSVQGHTKGEGLYLSVAPRNTPKKCKEGRGERERGGKRIKAPDRFQ